MSKVRKSILIIGILLIVVAASLATALALFASGSIKTDPIELVYSVKDVGKVYDGTPLKATECRLDSGALSAGHYAEYEFLGEQTGVGTSRSDLSVKIYDQQGYNVSHSYNIKVLSGELTVTAKPLTIDLPSQKVVYNGSTVSFANYKVSEESEGGLVSGHKIYGSADAELLNVGDTLPEDLQPLVFDVAGNDVTANYDITFNMGEIEVVKRKISVCPESYEKVYDGEEYVAEKIKILDGSLVEGQTAKYKINENLTNKLRDADTLELQVTDFRIFALNGGEEIEVTDNYEIDMFETAVLKVTPRPVTVYAKSGEWVYDGADHTFENDGDPQKVEGLADTDAVVKVHYSGKLNGVGTAVNRILGVEFNCTDSNYAISRVDGTLEVTSYNLEITTPTAEKYYDGTELSSTDCGEIVLANGDHNIDIAEENAPSIINASSIENKFTCKITDGDGADVTGNYSIAYKYGTLTVNKMPVKVTLGTDETKYDGNAQTPKLTNDGVFSLVADVEGEDVAAPALTAGNFTVVSQTRNMTDAGEYTFSVKFNEEGKAANEVKLSDNYELEVSNYGYFRITPLSIKVKTEGKEKQYDGTPLTNGVANAVAADGFDKILSGHTVTVPKILPSVTDSGKEKNEFAVGVEFNGADVSRNYVITYDYGDLEVKPREIKLTLKKFINNNAFTYNGSPVTVSPEEAITIQNGTVLINGKERVLIEKKNFKIKPDDAKIVDVKTTNYTYGVEIDKALENNFNITYTGDGEGKGEIAVKAAPVTVILKNINRTYNSKNQQLDSYTAIKSILYDKSGLLSYVDFDVKFKNSFTSLAGSYDYSVEIKKHNSTDAVKKDNYKITCVNETENDYEFGKLTVDKFALTVTTRDVQLVYNGKAQTDCDAANIEHSGLVEGDGTFRHELTVVESDGIPSVKNVGDSAVNNLKNFIKIVNHADGDFDVTGSYDINMVPGVMTVAPRTVTVKTASISGIYNGSAFSDDTIEVTNTLEGHEPEIVTEVPEITDVKDCKDADGNFVLNKFECVIKDERGKVDTNYKIEYEYGTIEIKPVQITAKTKSESRAYNGAVLSSNEIEISEGALVPGQNIRVASGIELPNITNVGSIENKYDFEIVSAGTKIDTGNYAITPDYGTLTVTPYEVTVNILDFTKADNSLTYNGGLQTLSVNDAVDGTFETADLVNPVTLIEPQNYEIIYFGNFVDAGSAEYSVRLADGEDFLADNFTLTVATESTRDNPDRAMVTINPMSVEVGVKDYTDFTFDNTYKVIELEDAVKKIDGKWDIKDADGVFVDTELLDIDDLKIEQGKIKDAGETYTYSLKITDKKKAKNFTLDAEGKVTVKKRNVTVTANTAEREYDGLVKTFEKSELLTISDSLLTEDYFNVDFGAAVEICDAKTYNYSVSEVTEVEKQAYLSNFNVIKDYAAAKVVINPAKVNVTLQELTFTYDGTQKTVNTTNAVITDNERFNKGWLELYFFNDKGEEDASVAVKDAGDYRYSVRIPEANKESSKNFDVNVKSDGAVTVEKAKASVILDNKYTEYDGKEYALKAGELIISFTGAKLAKGDFRLEYIDSIEAENNGTAAPAHKNVGYYNYTAQLSDEKAKNYELPVAIGTVNITSRQITVTTPSDEKVYDGSELKADGTGEKKITFAPVISGFTAQLADGQTAPAIIGVGEIANKYDVKISDSDNADATANFTLNYIYGNLKVTPKTITVTTKDVKKTYDGEPLTAETDKIEVSGLPSADFRAEYSNLASITDAGSVDGVAVCKVKKGGEDVSDNFIIKYVYGELTVEKINWQVEYKDYTGATYAAKTYSGEAFKPTIENDLVNSTFKSSDGSAVTNADSLFGEADVTFVTSADIRDAGNYEYWIELSANMKKNFTLSSYGNGKVKVVPFEISFNSGTAIKEFSYTGEDQSDELDNLIGQIWAKGVVEDGAVIPAELNAAMFRAVQPVGGMINAAKYKTGLEISDSVVARNYIVKNNVFVEIVPIEIDVSLKSFTGASAFVYSGKNVEIDVNEAITAIVPANDKDKTVVDKYMHKSYFAVDYKGGMVLAQDELYKYAVEITDNTAKSNFTLAVNSADVQIKKREIRLGLNDLVISGQEYNDYETFNVKNLLYVVPGCSVVESDGFSIVSATARQVGDDMRITLENYEWKFAKNEDCYDVKFDIPAGESMLTARLVIMG